MKENALDVSEAFYVKVVENVDEWVYITVLNEASGDLTEEVLESTTGGIPLSSFNPDIP